MKVIILAAGRGVRLGALTAHRPKCLLEFGSETILERALRILHECGISSEDITIVAGYKAETVSARYDNVIVNEAYYKTDNSYSLYLALQQVTEDVLVLDGDLVFEPALIKHLLQVREPNWLLCRKSNSSLGDTGILQNDNGTVAAIGKHIGGTTYSYVGIARISRQAVSDFIKELYTNMSAWYTIPLNHLLMNHPFYVQTAQQPVMEINTNFDYLSAKAAYGIENVKIVVTGASGLLGKKIYHILKRNYEVIGIRHQNKSSDFFSLDLNNREAVRAFFELNRPQIVINCAGIAEPDICEIDHEAASRINVEAVRILCEICKEFDTKLIHISTDYVFDGNDTSEYTPEHERFPQNYYGFTKMQAEDIVWQYENSLTVRIPVIYGYNDIGDKETFPLKVIRALEKRRPLYLDHKQIRYPVLTDEVALILSKSLSMTGILHISSSRPVTKYTWAKVIARQFGYDETLIHEDRQSNLKNRPAHVRLELADPMHAASDVEHGTEIMKAQMYCAFKLVYASQPEHDIFEKSVGEYRYKLGMALGCTLPADVVKSLDYIVPVPSSGLYYAMGVAETTQVPYIQGLYKTDPRSRSFQIADNRLREKMIHSKILPIRKLIEGKAIALVDEAVFTGTTLKVVCDICKACHVRKIYICIPTPPCYNRCGNYMRPERELLAEYKEIEELKNYFKVENIFFQPFDNFRESLKTIDRICYKCFQQ